MRKISKSFATILIVMILWSLFPATAFADVWEFGSSGPGRNPFTPRGYLVDTESGQHWLRSTYDNSGFYVRYSGVANGVDYIEATKEDGSNYTFYAMTDRNPWTDKKDWLSYGKKFLFAYKNGTRIGNFNDYVKTPAVRADEVDPSGQGSCWAFKIENFKLEPGCLYEFGFMRGMQANNGITLVLAENEEGYPIGYIQQTSAGVTSQEKAKYNMEKYNEFEFISSWSKRSDGKGYNVNTVPMRFSVQTYADLTKWENAAENAQNFLDSVKESDYKNGKYIRSNIQQLQSLLKKLKKEAKDEVRLMLQAQANTKMRSMIKELEAMMEKAKSEKPEPADMEKLKAKIKEAEALYAKASVNVGTDVGQYGKIEVENLKAEISNAKELDKYYPQDEINQQIQKLEDAMTEVKASKVMEAQMVFYDKVTGIYAIAPASALSENAKFFVRVMDKETDVYQAMESNLSEEETESIFYRIQFYEGDKAVKPKKAVEIQMPISDDISHSSSTVYAVGAKGTLKKVASVNANGTQIFKTQEVTDFVLAGSTATEEEKAQARGERMQSIMAQKKDQNADNTQNQLEKKKQKKEQAKDPINKILKRNQNTATFSNDVQKETNPIYLLMAAGILAVAGIALGIRGLWDSRKSREQ